MNSALGLKCLQPQFSISPVLSPLLSSPPSHQGHPRPADRDPVLLFLSSWTIFSPGPFPWMYTRCPVCLPPPFLSIFFLPLTPGAVCGPQPITCLGHNLPLSSPLPAAVPLLGLSSSSPDLSWVFPKCGRNTKSKPLSISTCHNFIINPPELIHILHSFFHPLHSNFQPEHHRAFTNSQPLLLILLQLFIFSLPEKAISDGFNILKPAELMGRAEGGHCFAVGCQELLLSKSHRKAEHGYSDTKIPLFLPSLPPKPSQPISKPCQLQSALTAWD